MNSLITIFLALALSLLLVNNTHITIQQTNAQDNTSSVGTLKSNENLNSEMKTYILIFGQRTVGNVDNSTKIVSSIVGQNLIKIEEEFLEEISMAPSQQLEEQVQKLINDGREGKQCGINLTTQEGQKILVDCISSGNTLIWYIHPSKS
ncbi:MAG TPA: hypothetical protein VFU79_03325 [Nitrososphaeraceae archaeon]|nr:hypothetical protein [Nitrososphaeraceae archaeon]